MNYINAAHLAGILGGDVSGNNVSAPGPNNVDKRRDRSMSITVDPNAPDGFLVKSHSAKNSDMECKEYVRAKLGLPEWKPDTRPAPVTKPRVVCHYEYQDADGEPYLRVTRKSDKSFAQSHWDLDGWVFGKPKGDPVPYRLPDIIARPDETIWLVEGEKDADNLAALGLLATTAPGGGSAFPMTPEFGRWFDGRTVVAIADNDSTGAKWRERVSHAIADVTHLSMPAPHKDVTDWLQAGGTRPELEAMADNPSPVLTMPTDEPVTLSITPTPFTWTDPTTIKPREWLYDTHLIRKFVSLTISPGGLGKSSLALVEALSMVTRRELLEDATLYEPEPLRVWYWNGEDPQEETTRRVMAACLKYGISADDLGGRFFTDSGRDQPMTLGSIDKGQIVLNEAMFEDIEATMIANRIDVFIADPFVSAHHLGENDNNAIDALIKRLGKLADRTNAAVGIVHHVRKPSSTQAETDVNDARGASALLGGVRSARVLNVMSEDVATAAGISSDIRARYFSVTDGKSNMAVKDADARWRYLDSVALGNQTDIRKSDNVGVVAYYKLPKEARAMADFSRAEDEMRRLLSASDMLQHWSGRGRKPTDWLGHKIMDGLKIHDNDHEAVVQKLILSWIKDGLIETREGYDEKRNRKIFLTMTSTPFQAGGYPENPEDTPF